MKQPDGLIAVLLDSSAPDGDRDDAAMDLGRFDEPEAEDALLKIALDPDVEEILADSAGESLWEIWSRKKKFNPELVSRMHPSARKFFEEA